MKQQIKFRPESQAILLFEMAEFLGYNGLIMVNRKQKSPPTTYLFLSLKKAD